MSGAQARTPGVSSGQKTAFSGSVVDEERCGVGRGEGARKKDGRKSRLVSSDLRPEMPTAFP